MRALMDEVVRCLREMDAAAVTVRDGHCTGLYDYGRHARPGLKRPQCEVEWSRRLRAMLTERGYACAAEVRYPSPSGPMSRTRCDLVVTLDEGAAWIEIKGAWRSYWKGRGPYLSYLLHPLVEGLMAKSHTVPRDLEKLRTLTSADARWVCEVVVGFDAIDDPMDGDIARLEGLMGGAGRVRRSGSGSRRGGMIRGERGSGWVCGGGGGRRGSTACGCADKRAAPGVVFLLSSSLGPIDKDGRHARMEVVMNNGNGMALVSSVAIAIAIAGAASASAWAGSPPDYGMNFVSIGHAGNRLPTSEEAPFGTPYGSVDYEYRITQTPVTVGMWWEFVQAYAPYTDDASQAFTSNWILRDFDGNLHPPAEVALQYPADASFRYAARFVNWLHNGKGSDQASFENGVYDTSTFTQNPDGTYNDQSARSPGSKYWIPTIDEWTKANYYDPNRYGPGQEGYWLYPDGGNDPLVPGLPENGGETDAGDFAGAVPSPVGSYPWSESPMGMLDASGGIREWTSSLDSNGGPHLIPDTALGDPDWEFFDRLDFTRTWPPTAPFLGFRVVSTVPAPGTVAILWISVVGVHQRRRR